MSHRVQATRRRLLAAGLATGLSGAAGCSGSQSDAEPTTETAGATNETDTGTATRAVETVVSVPGDPQPENLAVDTDGTLYFGLRNGELRRVASDRLGDGVALEATELVATLPATTGVEIADDGTIYVAVPSDGEQEGVWEVSTDGDASQLATVSGFPNDILADGDRLLVTESTDGTVFEIGTDGSKSTWLDDDRLDPSGFGVNGITQDAAGDVYVAVMEATDDTGQLLRVPVADDGSAGEGVVANDGSTLFGADGITAHDGSVYVAVNHRQQVLELWGEEESATMATAEDGLVFPSDVVVDPSGSHLYICDLASGSPGSAGIYRTTI